MRSRPRAALHIAFASLALSAFARPSLAQQSNLASRESGVRGTVVDSARAPVAGAEVLLVKGDSAIRVTRTTENGRFDMDGVSGGSYVLVVRRLGFRARTYDVELEAGRAPKSIVAVLSSMPTELEQVRVEAEIDDSNGKLREFYAHKARAQFGYFFDPQQIRALKPRNPSELLRAVPGVRLTASGRFGSLVRLRGCRPLLWIDGVRVPGAELDETVSPNDIAALEVYSSFAGIPPQYVDRNTNCGAIIVWTRT